MPALAIWTPEDGVLGAVAPLGLAAAAGTALVVDLDPVGPAYPGEASLAELTADGPRRRDLTPPRDGLAVLRNGGVTAAEAAPVLAALQEGWPSVVFRLSPRHPGGPAAAELGPSVPVVPVRPLLPGWITPSRGSVVPAVYQAAGWRLPAPGPGPVLPKPRSMTWRSLLGGRVPPPDRWIRAWRRVWGFPWP